MCRAHVWIATASQLGVQLVNDGPKPGEEKER
jgi:hypothetical protein